MAVCIRSGSQRRVPRRGLGIGVVVVAIFKVGAVIEEKAKALALEVCAIAVQIVGAKLIDHQKDDQLRMGIVGAGVGARRQRENQQGDKQPAQGALDV